MATSAPEWPHEHADSCSNARPPASAACLRRPAGGLLCLAVPALAIVWFWWSDRLTHSITDDAFVEAHIVNVAPQTVSGHLVRVFVEENDRVEQGQILAEIDPVP